MGLYLQGLGVQALASAVELCALGWVNPPPSTGYHKGRLLVYHGTIDWFHHLRLPQISCSEGKAVQVASVFLGGVGGSGGGWGVVISFS